MSGVYISGPWTRVPCAHDPIILLPDHGLRPRIGYGKRGTEVRRGVCLGVAILRYCPPLLGLCMDLSRSSYVQVNMAIFEVDVLDH